MPGRGGKRGLQGADAAALLKEVPEAVRHGTLKAVLGLLPCRRFRLRWGPPLSRPAFRTVLRPAKLKDAHGMDEFLIGIFVPVLALRAGCPCCSLDMLEWFQSAVPGDAQRRPLRRRTQALECRPEGKAAPSGPSLCPRGRALAACHRSGREAGASMPAAVLRRPLAPSSGTVTWRRLRAFSTGKEDRLAQPQKETLTTPCRRPARDLPPEWREALPCEAPSAEAGPECPERPGRTALAKGGSRREAGAVQRSLEPARRTLSWGCGPVRACVRRRSASSASPACRRWKGERLSAVDLASFRRRCRHAAACRLGRVPAGPAVWPSGRLEGALAIARRASPGRASQSSGRRRLPARWGTCRLHR